jgi:hypothetical protein
MRQNVEAKKSGIAPLFLMITLLLVVLIAARVPLDTDMWWHLRAGETTVETGKPTLIDTMSFTKLGEPWVNHSWIAQVILYLLFRLGNYWGLEGYIVVLIAITVLFLWLQMKESPILKSALIIYGVFLISQVLTPRPQLFSLFLLAFTSWYLTCCVNGNYRKAWALPIIFIFWSNLHAGATIGVIYMVAYVGGNFLNTIFTKREERNWKNFFALAGWAIFAFFAIAVNPNGFSIYGISFITVQVRVQQYIQEWLAPDYHEPLHLMFLILLIANYVVLFLARRKFDWIDLAVSVLFSYFALTARRNIALFTVAVIPIFSKYVYFLISNTRKASIKINSKPLQPTTTRIINYGIIGLLFTIFLFKFYINGYPKLVESHIKDYYPTRQIQTLLNAKPEGNLLNEYNWGGYLAWEEMEYPVMIDARTDLYGDTIFNDWLSLIYTEPGWENLLQKYKIGSVMLYADRPLVQALQNKGWKIIQLDEVGVLLVP